MKALKALFLALLFCLLPLASSAGVSTVYEIFTGSFCDSNDDGIGDLNGICSKLDYLQTLGVDGIWLTPVSPSPSYHKYDVTDYMSIDEDFGTLDDFDTLVAQCTKRGITVLFDLVINHTSSEHPWFLSAVESLQNGDLTNPYIDYYQFTQGEGDHPVDGTDWYYAGSFGAHMPELNLDNPEVRSEILTIISFWIDHGVGGFRLDAATHYYDAQPQSNLEFLSWLNEVIEAIDPDIFIVAEAWTDEVAILDLYESGIDALFNFPLSSTGALAKAIQRESGSSFATRIVSWQQAIQDINTDAVAASFLSNHDQGRIAGVLLGDLQQEKQAAALYLLSPGVSFLYYGEEIGMTGSGIDENKRLPMLWSTTDSTGICDAPQDATQAQRLTMGADEQQTDTASLYWFYRQLLTVRNFYSVFTDGYAEVVETDDSRLAAYTLTDSEHTLLIVHNLSHDESLFMPSDGVLMAVFDTGNDQTYCTSDGALIAPRSSAVWVIN